jgi:hypothetical protein
MTTPQKKTFRDNINPAMNPALAFISSASPANEEETPAETTTPAEVVAPQAEGASTPEGSNDNTPRKAKPRKMLDIRRPETKTARMQLLLLPRVYKKLKDRAKIEGTSMNNLVNIFLEDALDELIAREEGQTTDGEE